MKTSVGSESPWRRTPLNRRNKKPLYFHQHDQLKDRRTLCAVDKRPIPDLGIKNSYVGVIQRTVVYRPILDGERLLPA